MGSAGSGTFGNYKPSKKDDQCMNDLEDVILEDVARLPYYLENRDVPSLMSEVNVIREVYHGRIAVESTDDGLVLGLLPTEYNYILTCLAKGISYSGHVSYCIDTPIPKVKVNLYGNK
ncbi:hypothetical protein [Caldifermentibacillus hisashii]|uniref:hypothetical protein n=1 Tax=Caldifermentibacillus hisashii TaxID=996558 RepID=UPI001C11E7EE|nr:hypothetical protein [Caldifermentibacillus hisashii]MBU5343930.1 hypothetical protein [Caldifermentibacillus hisashii]